MSYEDFCLCTSEELEAIFKAYGRKLEDASRDEWERMRLLATITIQPHIRARMTPQRLIPLPWDKKKSTPVKEVEVNISQEERQARFEKLAKNLND